MTGLDKMIAQILEEAEATAAKTLNKAKEEAAAITEEAKTQCLTLEAEAKHHSDTEVDQYWQRIQSSSDLLRKKEILKAKQDVIAQVIDEAYQALLKQEDDDYFSMIKNMLTAYTLPKAGEIYFSQTDLDRLPAGFKEEMDRITKSKGGSLTLAKESKNIDAGFILVYGGVEENCSLRALFHAKQDELQDQVQELLFD